VSACEQLERARTTAKGFGIDLKSNSVELSLANPAPLLDGTLDACQRNDVLVFANRPLGGGLLGAYTMMDPTGGNSCKPRFSFKELEPLYPVHKALREVAKKYSEKLGKRVSTAQVSVNWVRAKGAVPLVSE
jgi:aryl-alcohol dehydrogenase-like predicted oxidoreductase